VGWRPGTGGCWNGSAPPRPGAPTALTALLLAGGLSRAVATAAAAGAAAALLASPIIWSHCYLLAVPAAAVRWPRATPPVYAALSWLVTVPHLPDTLPCAGTHISHGRALVAAAGAATLLFLVADLGAAGAAAVARRRTGRAA